MPAAFRETYDIVVVGAGHAGVEAALAAARLGRHVLCLSMNLDAIANLPCNPSIGGAAKGQLVREIDALGGAMAEIADQATLQFRMLNRSKGAAVLSPRAQIDRRLYQGLMKKRLEDEPGLVLRQDEVTRLLLDGRRVSGVETRLGAHYDAQAVILATGTYLAAKIIIGEHAHAAGPDNHFPANELALSLKACGIELQRFKTGTPPRIHARGVDFERLERQQADTEGVFSFLNEMAGRTQAPRLEDCWLAWTNEKTHAIIRENAWRSPLFTGLVEGTGPRYCPSIEDKIRRFPGRERHQIFLEPTGEGSAELYIQGMSTSLPLDVQQLMLNSVTGLEHAFVERHAYAIDYDCLAAGELDSSLAVRGIAGLWAAGQICGSSGYEEAAAQGLVAGLNAARWLDGKAPVIFERDEAYIGVLIDDLVTKTIDEPYRMMTARAEWRLLLRQDNADLRLTPRGRELGLVDDHRWALFSAKRERLETELARVRRERVRVDEHLTACLATVGTQVPAATITLAELLARPGIDYEFLEAFDGGRPPDLPDDVRREVEISLRYEGYIALEKRRIARFRHLEDRELPLGMPWGEISGLSHEARDKLARIRPRSVGQAGRIAGVSPADIQVLLVWLERAERSRV
ncbi:MAG: tRNA uridine-5-carboxymethylaminomethyl(34) synthesis enzyme MnmG [Bacillota bacterium]|nr:tRNA uridine-5-carboxymethylaminomethyl(34) synthesis enzyme MnmG [Bacillota bacterium]